MRLLPAELGAWAHARGDAVTYVVARARPGPTGDRPAERADLAHPAEIWRHWPAPRCCASTACSRRAPSAPRSKSAAHDADLLHLHSNGLIVEVAAAWAARRDLPYVLTLYGTEIWHFKPRWPVDPFARAYRRAAEVTFYSRRLMERAREVGLDRPGLGVVYPAVGSAFRPLDAERASARPRGRSASPSHGSCST